MSWTRVSRRWFRRFSVFTGVVRGLVRTGAVQRPGSVSERRGNACQLCPRLWVSGKPGGFWESGRFSGALERKKPRGVCSGVCSLIWLRGPDRTEPLIRRLLALLHSPAPVQNFPVWALVLRTPLIRYRSSPTGVHCPHEHSAKLCLHDKVEVAPKDMERPLCAAISVVRGNLKSTRKLTLRPTGELRSKYVCQSKAFSCQRPVIVLDQLLPSRRAPRPVPKSLKRTS